MPPWRNRLARSAVNRKVGGSSPPGGDINFLPSSHQEENMERLQLQNLFFFIAKLEKYDKNIFSVIQLKYSCRQLFIQIRMNNIYKSYSFLFQPICKRSFIHICHWCLKMYLETNYLKMG